MAFWGLYNMELFLKLTLLVVTIVGTIGISMIVYDKINNPEVINNVSICKP